MYICLPIRRDCCGVLWLGVLKLDTGQGEKEIKEAPMPIADTSTEMSLTNENDALEKKIKEAHCW